MINNCQLYITVRSCARHEFRGSYMKKILSCLLFVFVFFGCSDNEEYSISISQSVLQTSKNTVKNGETISLTADIKGNANGKPILFSVTYYCDQNEIGYSNDSTSNYRYDYVIENLSIGTHTLSYKADYRNGDAYSSTSASYPITVTE